MKMKLFLSCTLICCFQVIFQINAASLDSCSGVFGSSVKKQLCEANSYQTVNGADLDKTLDCVLKATNIVDKEGAGSFYSLYKPMQVYLSDGRKLNYNLESCMTRRLKYELPEGERAHGFYKCVMQNEARDAFKKVFNERVCK
uniref:Putative short from d7 salivary protein n=2 Tax=Anopheles triannulatus TaxID=58253 RepID=A0A2M4A2E9_9DIPT